MVDPFPVRSNTLGTTSPYQQTGGKRVDIIPFSLIDNILTRSADPPK